jgi:hypothetical protein
VRLVSKAKKPLRYAGVQHGASIAGAIPGGAASQL